MALRHRLDQELRSVLGRTDGNISHAAGLLGIPLRTMDSYMVLCDLRAYARRLRAAAKRPAKVA
jgi:hypothetical protein